MKTLLEFDDAGAADDEPAKGITVGDIRAWHDAMEELKVNYNIILTSWAGCRELLSKERAITARSLECKCSWCGASLLLLPRAGAEPATGQADHDGEAIGRTVGSIPATGAKS